MERQIDLFLEYMVREKESPSNTIAAYRNDLGQFAQFLKQAKSRTRKAGPGLSKLTEKNVNTYSTYLTKDKGYAVSTVARKLAVVKSFSLYLHSTGEIGADITGKIDSPKVEKISPRFHRCYAGIAKSS